MTKAMISSASTRSMRSDPPGARKFKSISSSDSMVASEAGPGPPYHAEIATAGTKNRKLGVGPSRLRTSVAPSAIAVTSRANAYRATNERRFSDLWLSLNVRPAKSTRTHPARQSDPQHRYATAETSVDEATN